MAASAWTPPADAPSTTTSRPTGRGSDSIASRGSDDIRPGKGATGTHRAHDQGFLLRANPKPAGTGRSRPSRRRMFRVVVVLVRSYLRERGAGANRVRNLVSSRDS